MSHDAVLTLIIKLTRNSVRLKVTHIQFEVLVSTTPIKRFWPTSSCIRWNIFQSNDKVILPTPVISYNYLLSTISKLNLVDPQYAPVYEIVLDLAFHEGYVTIRPRIQHAIFRVYITRSNSNFAPFSRME